MKFELTRPCAKCPFRSDRPFGLRRARCEEIAAGLFRQDATFICHETTKAPGTEQHCAGALILHEKLGRPNWRIRFAARLGLFEPQRLHLEAPVVDSVAEFIRIASARPLVLASARSEGSPRREGPR
jgi:hypothetical protein